MEIECPLCNALINIKEYCPHCAVKLEDWGPVRDYLEPYSPYLAVEMVNKGEDPTSCVHIFKCPLCDYDTRITIKHVIV